MRPQQPQPIFVQAPEAPRPRGNRAAAGLIGLLAAVVVFLIVGVLMIAGIMGGSSPGTSNWTTGDAPFVNGFGGVMTVFLVAGFSFQGTELIGVAAGE